MTFEEHVQWARDAPYWGPSLDAIISALEALAAERADGRYDVRRVRTETPHMREVREALAAVVPPFERGPASYSHWGMHA